MHAGDSRGYLYRNNELKQITTDHTIAQRLIESGAMEENDAAIATWRHVLWNCVGGGERVRPEALRLTIQRDDTILLCSDGLTIMLSDQEIQVILASQETSKAKVRNLLERANQAGGRDNITAVVCRIEALDKCGEDQAEMTPHDLATTIRG